MKKVSIIGHFGLGLHLLNGQTVKTKIVTDELEKRFGKEDVLKIDTHGSKFLTLFKSPFQAFKALTKSQNVIICPAHNGLRIFAPLLVFLKSFFKNRKLHYVVIGGWLSEFLKNRQRLEKRLKKFDWIYVETNTMKIALEKMGFENVVVMPNCKDLDIIDESELIYPSGEPYKLCTFSRVMKEKGIEDAVSAVRAVNESFCRTVYTLDIYGQVDANQTDWFDELKASFPDYVNYCGLVDYDKSVKVLKNYFALVFPTRFYTEGIPGTIIDAYAAGIPVISSKWESFDDIVEEGKTGFGYEFGDSVSLRSILLNVANNPKLITEKKKNALHKSNDYLPFNGLSVLINSILS